MQLRFLIVLQHHDSVKKRFLEIRRAGKTQLKSRRNEVYVKGFSRRTILHPTQST